MNPLKQYVWSHRYIDAVVLRFRDSDDNGTLDETLYYCNDANMNVTALVQGTPGHTHLGKVVERYAYDPYGKVTVLHGASGADSEVTGGVSEWDVDTAGDVDNEILYCGYRLDPESGLYQVRNRYYHPTLGRWMSTDPLGYVDGMSLYEYVRSNPVGNMDSTGLAVDKKLICCKLLRNLKQLYNLLRHGNKMTVDRAFHLVRIALADAAIAIVEKGKGRDWPTINKKRRDKEGKKIVNDLADWFFNLDILPNPNPKLIKFTRIVPIHKENVGREQNRGDRLWRIEYPESWYDHNKPAPRNVTYLHGMKGDYSYPEGFRSNQTSGRGMTDMARLIVHEVTHPIIGQMDKAHPHETQGGGIWPDKEGSDAFNELAEKWATEEHKIWENLDSKKLNESLKTATENSLDLLYQFLDEYRKPPRSCEQHYELTGALGVWVRRLDRRAAAKKAAEKWAKEVAERIRIRDAK